MTIPIRKRGIYWIPDTAVNLPPLAGTARTLHPQRPFLVVSNDNDNARDEWLIVLGFPLSTSDEFRSPYDVLLAAGTANLPEDSWVRIPLLQPIAKTKISSDIGSVDSGIMERCFGQLLRYADELH